MFILILFCEMYIHLDGSTSTQPPSSQLVVYLTYPDFLLPFFRFFPNAVNIDAAVIVIDIIIIVLLTILIAVEKKLCISKNQGKG